MTNNHEKLPSMQRVKQLINWMNPFKIVGLLGVIFHFNTNILLANSGGPDQTQHSKISDLDQCGLPMSHKNDTELSLE